MATKILIDITEQTINCEIEGHGKELLVRLTHLFVEDQTARKLFDTAIKMAKTHELIEKIEEPTNTKK